MPSILDVESINLGIMMAMIGGGEICAISTLIDDEGDETEDRSEAVAFVCGPTKSGHYLTDLVSNFDKKRSVN